MPPLTLDRISGCVLRDLQLQKDFHSELCDTVLKLGSIEKKVHGCVLSVNSSVFLLAYERWIAYPIKTGPLVININLQTNSDSSVYQYGDALDAVISYCYGDDISISPAVCKGLYNLADALKIMELVTFCRNYLEGSKSSEKRPQLSPKHFESCDTDDEYSEAESDRTAGALAADVDGEASSCETDSLPHEQICEFLEKNLTSRFEAIKSPQKPLFPRTQLSADDANEDASTAATPPDSSRVTQTPEYRNSNTINPTATRTAIKKQRAKPTPTLRARKRKFDYTNTASRDDEESIQRFVTTIQQRIENEKRGLKDVVEGPCPFRLQDRRRLYFCPSCQMTSRYDQSVVSHYLVCHTDYSVQCQDCGAKFRCKNYLFNHRRLSHPKTGKPVQYLCPYCGFKAVSRCRLKEHERKHTGLLLQCRAPGCTYRHHKQDIVNLHYRQRHSGERPFLCPTCGSRFATQQSLTRHAKSHSKPCSCPLCGHRAAHGWNINAHMRKRHPNHSTAAYTK